MELKALDLTEACRSVPSNQSPLPSTPTDSERLLQQAISPGESIR
jgi:hypothetical protein